MKRSGPLRRRTPLRAQRQIRRRAHDPVSRSTKQRIIERDGGCVLARFEPTHECWGQHEVHHRKLRRHGDHTDSNLVTLCSAGHLYVHGHPAVARSFGLLLHSWEDVWPLEGG